MLFGNCTRPLQTLVSDGSCAGNGKGKLTSGGQRYGVWIDGLRDC